MPNDYPGGTTAGSVDYSDNPTPVHKNIYDAREIVISKIKTKE